MQIIDCVHMKINILSDVHLGHGLGTERESDPFDALEEFVEKSLGCDLILLAGDIFDSRSPQTEIIARAMNILIKPILAESSTALAAGAGKDISKLSGMNSMGIPVVAISGTHERRARGLVNVVEAFEHAGFLIYLHCNGVILEKEGERVCIQGMSGVPEQFAGSVLKEWGPKPADGCVNILMLHQDIEGLMYTKSGLKTSELPEGFDLYVSGHIHTPQVHKAGGGQLLVCGSPVTTQLKEEEAMDKGFWSYDTGPKNLEFRTLENTRKVYIKSLPALAGAKEIVEEIENILKASHRKKPIIKIIIKGRGQDISENSIAARYSDRAIVHLKTEFEKEEMQPKTLEEHKLTVQELGRRLLIQNLRDSGLRPEVFENIFELLAENNTGRAYEQLNKEAGAK